MVENVHGFAHSTKVHLGHNLRFLDGGRVKMHEPSGRLPRLLLLIVHSVLLHERHLVDIYAGLLLAEHLLPMRLAQLLVNYVYSVVDLLLNLLANLGDGLLVRPLGRNLAHVVHCGAHITELLHVVIQG